jgi:hypothetical protein
VTWLKDNEPVRLYLYSVALVLFAGLNLAGILSDEWQLFAISSAAVVLGVVGGANAARAKVEPTGRHSAPEPADA